jgi:small subunit ribosomal protein S14
MAKKSVIERNKKRRRMAKKYREKRELLRKEGKWEELQKLPKNSSPTRVSNRSFLSGRKKGYMRDFGIDRIEFRELANEGKIPGIRKSSW